MSKKLLFICLSISIFIIFNNLSAETTTLIPIKKPILTAEEINKKLSKNILIPIPKPKKIDKIVIKEKDITKIKKEKKLSFNIPKKKPSISGVTTARSVKISKYYSKKDFIIARKAISEMQKSRWA